MTRGTGRRIDLALALRRRKTGEIVLAAGGVWDLWDRRYTGERPSKVKVIDLNEGGQLELVRWYATWLQAFRDGTPRDTSLVLAAGERRGGKTFVALLCAMALLIDVPAVDGSSTGGWVVSVSYPEREEIDRAMIEHIPHAWWRYRGSPEFRYTLVNGATLRNVSADDPETLRRGRVDVVLYNEAQKMPLRALTNGIYGTADKGGIALLAANPPRRKVGEWVMTIKQAIDENKIGSARHFPFRAKDNPMVDQPARARVGEILRYLDPAAARADDEGEWLPIGARAYHQFDPLRNLITELPMVGDCTAEITRRKVGRIFQHWAGGDFQKKPGTCGVFLRAFGNPKAPIYVVVGEVCSEGSEDDFLDAVWDYGGDERMRPESLVWVGDASGGWKSYEDRNFKGRVSFDVFKARRWQIEPPREKRTDRGEHPANPDVTDRLGLVNRLLAAGRLLILATTCPRLEAGLRHCELGGTGKPRAPLDNPTAWHPHVTDALGYALWWGEPLPQAAPSGQPRDVKLIDMRRR